MHIKQKLTPKSRHTFVGIEVGGLLANKKSNTLSIADKKILKAVGSKIRQIREKKNQSVYDITGDDLLIKSRQHWQSIENGQKNINVTTIFKIAKTLGVKAEDLIKDL